MLAAVRSAGRLAVRRNVSGVRNMSSGYSVEEEVKEMNKWRIVTYLAIPVCIAKAFVDLSANHAHADEMPEYPYLHIRKKDFPWGPDGLFERKHEH